MKNADNTIWILGNETIATICVTSRDTYFATITMITTFQHSSTGLLNILDHSAKNAT